LSDRFTGKPAVIGEAFLREVNATVQQRQQQGKSQEFHVAEFLPKE